MVAGYQRGSVMAINVPEGVPLVTMAEGHIGKEFDVVLVPLRDGTGTRVVLQTSLCVDDGGVKRWIDVRRWLPARIQTREEAEEMPVARRLLSYTTKQKVRFFGRPSVRAWANDPTAGNDKKAVDGRLVLDLISGEILNDVATADGNF